MICPNCGGDYADWAQKCPYCGSVNELADEQVYLAHLEEIRQRLDQVDEESDQEYHSGMNRSLKLALRIAGIVLAIVLGIILLGNVCGKLLDKKSENRELLQLEWEKTEFPVLDSLYEAEDYDGIMEEYFRILDSKEEQDFDLFDWPHYEFCFDYYIYYYELKIEADEYRADPETNSYELQDIIYQGLYLARDISESTLSNQIKGYTINGKNGITEEEAELVRGYQKEAAAILGDVLGWSDSDLDENYNKCLKDGYLSWTECDKLADKILKKGA